MHVDYFDRSNPAVTVSDRRKFFPTLIVYPSAAASLQVADGAFPAAGGVLPRLADPRISPLSSGCNLQVEQLQALTRARQLRSDGLRHRRALRLRRRSDRAQCRLVERR